MIDDKPNTMKYLNRLNNLNSILRKSKQSFYDASKSPVPCRVYSDRSRVTIGGVTKTIQEAKNPELVPVNYMKLANSQSSLTHLRWLMQKEQLGQDVFLIGPPGPLKRTLALAYLEITQREVEYISLTRDTTESDLKQRREIENATSYYHDQSAVRAAILGRILILDGIEKAERNVLPILNNLLENREMQLDDGRLLIPPDRYDKLLQDHTHAELDDMKLVRVSEDFRVIALGLPSPPYLGHPLDPPLRSRFQARDVSVVSFKDNLEDLTKKFPKVNQEQLKQILSFSYTLLSDEAKALSLPDFPVDNLPLILGVLEKFPFTDSESLLSRLYPTGLFLPSDSKSYVDDLLNTFNLDNSKKKNLKILNIEKDSSSATVNVLFGDQQASAKVSAGMSAIPQSPYMRTTFHDTLLAELMTSHSIGDFCLVGPKGSGKSAAVGELARLLGYQVEPILLYQDMSARDLVQQRDTSSAGNTTWRLSPLIQAALSGKMAILDGLHRLHHGTLVVLHRLLNDRELQLYDGRRILRADRYDQIRTSLNLDDKGMAEKGVLRIHPDFRIVGLAEPPAIGSSQGQWLDSQSMPLFLYHMMRLPSQSEVEKIVEYRVGEVNPAIQKLIKVSARLSQSSDPALRSVGQNLSLRQVLRIARKLKAYPAFDLHDAIYKACLVRFLPSLAKKSLDSVLEQHDIESQAQSTGQSTECTVVDGVLRIGNTHSPLYKPKSSSKIPQTLFFDIDQHITMLEHMLQDWLLGEHLLLVGNQGTGKNKLTDRFLQLLNRPREYIQLHRDTTVQSLTLQPTVVQGRIVHEDSPLVSAVQSGSVLVVDEADKAPTHITSVLKTLVECGEMLLSDGRRIVPAEHPLASSVPALGEPGVIVCHPDFRMIVLANRPGFPFLGNDFFGALGDLFGCHAIDNPSPESEMALLRAYGPDVPEAVMRNIVSAFGELRELADQGLLQYPYSTREVVNVVKHLQKFPKEGVVSVLRNVFDFDSWTGEAKDTLTDVMRKHGLPIGASPNNIDLAKKKPGSK